MCRELSITDDKNPPFKERPAKAVSDEGGVFDLQSLSSPECDRGDHEKREKRRHTDRYEDDFRCRGHYSQTPFAHDKVCLFSLSESQFQSKPE